MKGHCKLCKKNSDLVKSHILPSFVFKRLKEKSATGRIRAVEQPNKPVQDGYKPYYLCLSCEKLFNAWETKFANEIFHPFCDGLIDKKSYDAWFLKFCVSVSWRIITYLIEENHMSHFSSDGLIEKAFYAQNVWQEFLLGKLDNPAQYEQHFLPLPSFCKFLSYRQRSLPVKINRYIVGNIAMDAIRYRGREESYIVGKLGRLVIIGFINTQEPKHWFGTKVHVKHGMIKPEERRISGLLIKYFEKGARNKADFQKGLPDKQKENIEKICEKNINKVKNSESYKALNYDYQLFGKDALID